MWQAWTWKGGVACLCDSQHCESAGLLGTWRGVRLGRSGPPSSSQRSRFGGLHRREAVSHRVP